MTKGKSNKQKPQNQNQKQQENTNNNETVETTNSENSNESKSAKPLNVERLTKTINYIMEWNEKISRLPPFGESLHLGKIVDPLFQQKVADLIDDINDRIRKNCADVETKEFAELVSTLEEYEKMFKEAVLVFKAKYAWAHIRSLSILEFIHSQLSKKITIDQNYLIGYFKLGELIEMRARDSVVRVEGEKNDLVLKLQDKLLTEDDCDGFIAKTLALLKKLESARLEQDLKLLKIYKDYKQISVDYLHVDAHDLDLQFINYFNELYLTCNVDALERVKRKKANDINRFFFECTVGPRILRLAECFNRFEKLIQDTELFNTRYAVEKLRVQEQEDSFC